MRRSRFGCASAIVIALVIVAWYSLRLSLPWEPRAAATAVELRELPLLFSLGVWRDRVDPSLIAIVWFESSVAPPSMVTFDGRKRSAPTTVTTEQLRARYEPFDAAAALREVRVELHGIDLPRPRPYLFLFPGPGGPGILRQHSLFGRIDLVENATGRVLMSRTVINGDAIPSPDELVSVDPAGKTIAVKAQGADGVWRVWFFDRR